MTGLLSAEVYKLVRSKSFYICIAVIIGVVFLMYVTIGLAERIQRGEVENGTAGVVVSVQEEDGNPGLQELSIAEMIGQMFSGDLVPCVLAVFVSIFVVGEYGSGMMKNVAGKGCARWKIFLAKLIMTELASVLIILTGMGASLLAGLLFKGGSSFTAVFWKNLAIYGGLQLLMEMALVAIFVLAGELTRSYAAGISLGIGIAAFPMLIVSGLDMLFTGSSFTPSAWWLVSRSVSCPYEGFSGGYAVETFLVSAVWFALAAGLGIRHFSRADIK